MTKKKDKDIQQALNALQALGIDPVTLATLLQNKESKEDKAGKNKAKGAFREKRWALFETLKKEFYKVRYRADFIYVTVMTTKDVKYFSVKLDREELKTILLYKSEFTGFRKVERELIKQYKWTKTGIQQLIQDLKTVK